MVDKLSEEYQAKTAEITTMNGDINCVAVKYSAFICLGKLYRQGEQIRGPFLEGPEKFSHSNSQSKVL